MAEIMIRGMELPKENDYTIAIVYGDGVVTEYHEDYWVRGADGEKQLGTAVPVPPHGDLIDRDTARETIKPWSPEDERAGCTFDTVKKLMHTMLTRAPTIIPASE